MDIETLLARDGAVLMDGGMGSSVRDRGVDVSTPLWGSFALMTDEGLKVNDGVHCDFITAGAELVVANTHNATGPKCADYVAASAVRDWPGKALDANALQRFLIDEALASVRRGVTWFADRDPQKSAADRDVAVATCVGSVDGAYATASRVPVAAAQAVLERAFEVHNEAGSPMILFETLTTRQEIEGLARAAVHSARGPFGVGFACGRDGRTLGGVRIEEAVDLLADASPRLWFIQCTDFDVVTPALETLVAARPGLGDVGVYANDGRTWEPPVWRGERVSEGTYAKAARGWRDAGARVIGGCCGTSPSHVAALWGVCRGTSES